MEGTEHVPIWEQGTVGTSTVSSVLSAPSDIAADRRLGALIAEGEATRTTSGRSNLVAPGRWLLVVGGAALLAFAPVDLPRMPPRTVSAVQHAPTRFSLSRGSAAPIQELRWMETATGLPKERIGRLVRASRPTLDAWQRGGPIRDSNRRRLLAVHAVLQLAWQRAPSQSALAAWLDTPRGTDGVTPTEMIERGELGRARLSALGNIPSELKPPPAWVGEAIPEAFQGWREPAPEDVIQEREEGAVSPEPVAALFDDPGPDDRAPTLDL
jgi:hypothetical protein